MSIWQELRRRKVLQVAAAYIVIAWVLMQVASLLEATLELPNWFDKVAFAALLLGFPLALLLSWAYDVRPDDTHEVSAAPQDRSAFLATLVVLVFGALAYSYFLFQEESLDTTNEAPGPSIAVLPFADMSPDGDQAWFADGISEEILNVLARIEGLQVASRTASFRYRGENTDIKAAATEMGVATVLEGSVRKSQDELRITVQLINSADGYHIWSGTYDRKLEDIFTIQEDIASSVAGILGVSLGVGGANGFPGAGTRNLEAYEAFMQESYERATQLDPNYAVAWARLGVSTVSTMWNNSVLDAPDIIDRAYPLVARAIELDPESSQAQSQFATLIYAKMDWLRAEAAFAKALALKRNRDNLFGYGNFLMRSGRTSDARRNYSESDTVERVAHGPSRLRMNVELSQRRFAEARRIAARLSEGLRLQANISIALNDGSPDDLRAAISALPKDDPAAIALYAELARELNSPEAVLARLRAVHADTETQWPSKYHDIALLAAYFGDPEFALEVFSTELRHTTIRFGALWYPVMSDVRRLDAFKELMTELNLVEYWRIHGWADACQPVGDEDFACM